jgi:HSP20 family protein
VVTIEDTITSMEKLLTAVTGQAPPASEPAYAPIPAEKDPIQHVDEQISRLLTLLEGGGAASRGSLGPAFSPPLSVSETDTEVVLRFQLPGVKREDVEVASKGGILTVRGQTALPEDERLKLSEHPVGPFRRTVILPPGLEPREPKALMRDGLLEIRIPREKTEPAAAKPVRVN